MSYLISEEDKNKILSTVHIEDVIGKSVNLKKAGINRVGLCPFHADRTASMYVSSTKQIFKCFACGEGGNVIHFVMKNEGLTFPEAVKQLAKDNHIEIKIGEITPEEKQREQLRESISISLEAAQKQFRDNLRNSSAAFSYLKDKRGLTDEIIFLYGLGYARGDNQLTNEFVQKGFSFDVLQRAGLSKVKEDKGYKHDYFFNRIMFPFYHLNGKVIGFTGRILTETDNAPKYYNTGDTLLFNKGKVLFGLDQAKKEISRQSKAYFVEGQLDVLSFAQYGLKNTICGSGTALTDDQAILLHRFAETVVLVLDSDNAGVKAALRSIKIFLSYGFEVKGVILPQGEDPDSFSRKISEGKLVRVIRELEKDFLQYAYDLCKKDTDSNFDEIKILDQICECIAVIPDKALQRRYMEQTASLFNTQISYVSEKVKPKRSLKVEDWKDGFYGIDEATECLNEKTDKELCTLTFDQEEFINLFESETPVVYASGIPSDSDIQLLRSKINRIKVDNCEAIRPSSGDEPRGLNILKTLFKEGFDISISDIIECDEGIKKIKYRLFCDYYVSEYGSIIDADTTGIVKETVAKRCTDVIADSSDASRTMMMASYAKYLGIAKGSLEKMLKPLLAKKSKKVDFESKQVEAYDNMHPLDALYPPSYVEENTLIKSNYQKYRFFPWLDNDNIARAYVAQDENKSGNSVISDFVIEPLLHVTDDNGGNKRVVKFTHIFKQYDKYVELQSNTLASLQTLKVRLIEEGPYNFLGSSYQYDRIRQQLSYNFILCTELKILGQQPEGFFAFSNAILHKEDDVYKLQKIDPQGVVTHNKVNFYLPAFSNIHVKKREGNDSQKQARNIMYKDIPEKDQLSFFEWADLMNRVYTINDNGKWAILFTLTAAFRDFIYKKSGHFTAPFFIGPRGSGKTQIAESMRNFFMADTTPSFNLNTGTDAAFFLLLETFRNVIVLAEEYNDKMISDNKFQGLKSATLDGEGRIKIKDMGSKTMDSSDINASLVILGQEAPQQDDGSLGTRVILCNVPHRENDFTEEEREIFDRLKNHERIGLCNILIDVLKKRDVVEEYYMSMLNEEIKKLKEAIRIDLVNGEGLARIVNAVALMVTTCRLFEEHIPSLKLPFTYEAFFAIGKDKILTQLDQLSSSNKLTNFFKSISALITYRTVMLNREIKIREVNQVTIKLKGKNTETKNFAVPTKVLFIDITEIYNKYRVSVGEKEALSQSSLLSYFESLPAYIGLCKSTQFKWEEPVYASKGGLIGSGEDGMDAQVDQTARQVMKTETKNTSAYMFDYEQLKELMDVDFERKDNEPKVGNQKQNVLELPF